ncbi:MAG: hypothetical protein HZA17_04705 [Nitrospirae bacterium]|nr:hypothetical protein [Nitrospirota bacterium]
MLLIVMTPVSGLSHPGKTDRHGGHKCRKGCGQIGLAYGEYHLHDRDFRTIRVSGFRRDSGIDIPEPQQQVPAGQTEAPEVAGAVISDEPVHAGPAQRPVVAGAGVISAYDGNAFSLPLESLALLFFLLLIILLALRWRRRDI